MRIVTLDCPDCGTIVAGNVLLDNRVMECPRTGCERTLRFEDLPAADREHLEQHRELYRME